MAKFLVWLLYRLRVSGRENVPTEGGAILICNHMTYLDVVLIALSVGRKIRFLASDSLTGPHPLRWLVRMSSIEVIPPDRTPGSFEGNVAYLKAGGLLGIFPEGRISRTGNLMTLRSGFETLARASGVPVVPLSMDNLWQTRFSRFESANMRFKPRVFRPLIQVVIGAPMKADKVTLAGARQAMLDASEQAFQKREALQGNLAYNCLKGLASRPFFEQIVDYSTGRRSVKAGLVLALGLLLARHFKQRVSAKRLGIVMPPGIGGALVNLGCVLAGKVPVNLNITAGKAAIESAYLRGEIDVVVTAEPVRKKFPKFPWPENLIDVVDVLKAQSKLSILLRFAQVIVFPARLLAFCYGIPKRGDREEAGLLFTSGSSGEPKGVPLSHRNILSNAAQIDEVALLSRKGTCIMCCLPIFHSFGFTVTLWYPLMRQVRMVTLPSPLEQKKIAEAIAAEKVTVMVGSRTFLKPYLARVPSEKLASLDLAVAGAEKVTPEFFGLWKDKFGCAIHEGYGLTETAPAVGVNLFNPPAFEGEASPQVAYRQGSIGRPLPGISVRFTDSETGEELSLFEPGMLHLKGDNVFEGYLKDQERNEEVLRDGWFETGDLARMDEDGFLFIEGRQSRFSKIGGEMVPHGTVEEKIVEVMDLKESEVVPLAIGARYDDRKGEALVLLTTVPIKADDLRKKLTDAGLPNLWIPRIIKPIEEIPVLATGKLDLKACKALADT
ncbi:MAG: AMP-binding protein [Opitutae bacterium]|nr:AMP-binding protein [Opitutae bacterium]